MEPHLAEGCFHSLLIFSAQVRPAARRRDSLSSSAGGGLGSSSPVPAARARRRARARRSSGARRSGRGCRGAHAVELGLFLSSGLGSSSPPAAGSDPVEFQWWWREQESAALGSGADAGTSGAPHVMSGPLLHLLSRPHVASSSRSRWSSRAPPLPGRGGAPARRRHRGEGEAGNRTDQARPAELAFVAAGLELSGLSTPAADRAGLRRSFSSSTSICAARRSSGHPRPRGGGRQGRR
ncbi:unnamed protein product [Urochloa humidicola]